VVGYVAFGKDSIKLGIENLQTVKDPAIGDF